MIVMRLRGEDHKGGVSQLADTLFSLQLLLAALSGSGWAILND